VAVLPIRHHLVSVGRILIAGGLPLVGLGRQLVGFELRTGQRRRIASSVFAPPCGHRRFAAVRLAGQVADVADDKQCGEPTGWNVSSICMTATFPDRDGAASCPVGSGLFRR
jgi:hypothetical protein